MKRSMMAMLGRPDIAILPVLLAATVGIAWPLVRLGIAVVVVLVIVAGLTGAVPLRFAPAHALIGLMAALLVVSYAFPSLLRVGHARSDLVTLLAGLIVLAVCVAVRPSVDGLYACAALSGAVASVVVLSAGRYELGRLWGLGLNCNYLAALLTLPIVAACGLALKQQRWWLLAAVPSLVALYATESRGAAAALAGGLAALFVLRRRWWTQVIAVTASVAIGVAASSIAFRTSEPASERQVAMTTPSQGPEPLTNAPGAAAEERTGTGLSGSRTSSEYEYNNRVRVEAALVALGVVMDHPLRGIGYLGFADYALTTPAFALYMNTHNDYLRLAAESGVITALLLVAIMALAMRRRDPRLDTARAMVFCYAITLGLANTLSNFTVSVFFWAALGALLAHDVSRPIIRHGFLNALLRRPGEVGRSAT